MMAQPILEVKKLNTGFLHRGRQVSVVKDMSFEVQPGEALGILGESGCGKSMVALSVMGLVTPPGEVAGEILFRGQNLLADPRLYERVRGRHISMVFQEPRAMVNPLFTVGRHFMEILGWHFKLSRAEAADKAMELLGEAGLGGGREILRLYPHEMSGGILQRVMVALALSCEPDLIIADEPATALDMTVQARVLDCLKRFREKKGRAIVLITHDLGVISENCDRVLVMYAGEVVEAGPVREVFKNPAHPYTTALLDIYRALADFSPPPEKLSGERLCPIPGQVPEFGEVITGCPFSPRCGLKTAGCDAAGPPENAIGPGHTAACHRVGNAVELAAAARQSG